ncbi:MAG TPA: MFS transporter, partial [Dehalococcoidales bacterium]|nr:MFS transporter [Dehalococcoidales bacterium]
MTTKPVQQSKRNIFTGITSFWKDQDKDWKVTVTRTSVERFAYQIIFPYLSLYIIALGATAFNLGLVNSIGMIVAGLLGPFTGRLIDRNGPKGTYLVGIIFIAISYLIYAIATSWVFTIVALSAYWIGMWTAIHSCATICGNCLKNNVRATGMMVCETLAAGLLGMAGPLVGGFLVKQFGGVTANGIRPLFFIGLFISVVSFFVVLTQLSSRKWVIIDTPQVKQPSLFRESAQIIKSNPLLKRWMVIGALTYLPTGMILPYFQVFADQVKNASSLTLAVMVTVSALTSIIFAIPAGRLADRIGRKKVLFAIIPLFWLSLLTLIWAPGQAFLI